MGGSLRRMKKHKPKIMKRKKPKSAKTEKSKLPINLLVEKQSKDGTAMEADWDTTKPAATNYQRVGVVADVNAGFGRNTAADVLTEKAKTNPRILEDQVELDEEFKAACAQMRSCGRAAPKRLTAHQRKIVTALLEAHGENVDAMVLDRRRNPMQHSKGALEKMVESLKYWKEGSGVDFRVPNKRLW